MDFNKLALEMHEFHKGKISVNCKVEVKTRDDLSTAYTLGVAEPCRKIRDDKKEVYRYTAKGNLVAVVSDGTAVLGLGDIGPEAAMPVMEGKAILFKTFADIDAFPICLDTKDPDEIVKTYLGGGAIVCIFASAFLMYFGVIPQRVVDNVNSFMNSIGFLNFYIAALITGSILGMNRKLLLKAAVRFLPVAICAMTAAILAVGIVGAVTGYGFAEAIMYVAIPMMGGGMGAGVVPLSGMYAEALGQDSAVLISRMIPASTLGNVSAIVGAGLLAKLGSAKPSLTGNGQLMRKSDDSMKETIDNKPDYQMLGIGLILAMTFYILGVVVGKIVPAVHAYAWMIILVALSKAFGFIPEKFEKAAQQWSQFVMKNWTSALLVGIGISMIDLGAVISAFSPLYMLLVLVVVVCVSIGGYLVGFYPVESAITTGLCTANMGGTGDIAVLSAAKRMELLPFAQIATRICGSLILIVASILTKVLL